MNISWFAVRGDVWELIGWTMIHFLWMGCLVGVLAFASCILLKRVPPSLRYAHALLCFLLMALLPIAIAIWLQSHADHGVRIQSSAVAVAGTADLWAQPSGGAGEVPTDIVLQESISPATASASTELAWMKNTSSLVIVASLLSMGAEYLPWLWLVGAPSMLLLLITGAIGGEKLRKSSCVISEGPVFEAAEKLSRALRVQRTAAIGFCENIAAPMLIGVIRPMILLPATAMTSWTAEELEMVLIHELAHVRRCDNLVNLLQRLVEATLFFHPVVWLLSKWVRREREACCDSVVVRKTDKPHQYAELLVSIAGQVPRAALYQTRLSTAIASNSVRWRIRKILEIADEPVQTSSKAIGLAAGSLLVAATMLVLNVPSRGDADENKPTPTSGAQNDGLFDTRPPGLELPGAETPPATTPTSQSQSPPQPSPAIANGDQDQSVGPQSQPTDQIPDAMKYFAVTKDNPIVRKSYQIQADREHAIADILNSEKRWFPFEWAWNRDKLTLDITAPKAAHDFFFPGLIKAFNEGLIGGMRDPWSAHKSEVAEKTKATDLKDLALAKTSSSSSNLSPWPSPAIVDRPQDQSGGPQSELKDQVPDAMKYFAVTKDSPIIKKSYQIQPDREHAIAGAFNGFKEWQLPFEWEWIRESHTLVITAPKAAQDFFFPGIVTAFNEGQIGSVNPKAASRMQGSEKPNATEQSAGLGLNSTRRKWTTAQKSTNQRIQMIYIFTRRVPDYEFMEGWIARIEAEFWGAVETKRCDIDEQPAAAQYLKRRYDVQSLPALLIVRDGQVVTRIEGMKEDESALREAARIVSDTLKDVRSYRTSTITPTASPLASSKRPGPLTTTPTAPPIISQKPNTGNGEDGDRGRPEQPTNGLSAPSGSTLTTKRPFKLLYFGASALPMNRDFVANVAALEAEYFPLVDAERIDLDADRAQAEELMRRYGVTALPALLLLRGDTVEQHFEGVIKDQNPFTNILNALNESRIANKVVAIPTPLSDSGGKSTDDYLAQESDVSASQEARRMVEKEWLATVGELNRTNAEINAELIATTDGQIEVTQNDRIQQMARLPQLRKEMASLQKKFANLSELRSSDQRASTRPQMLYGGQSFDKWRENSVTDITEHQRLESLRAFAAFGANGMGPEASEAVLNIAVSLDWRDSGYSSQHFLQVTCVAAFAGDGSGGYRIPVADWLPLLLRDLKDSPQLQGFAVHLARKMRDPSPTRTAIVTALRNSEDDEIKQIGLSFSLEQDELKAPEFASP